MQKVNEQVCTVLWACAVIFFFNVLLHVGSHFKVYSVVGKFHPQRVISYLLTELESNQDKIKGGTQTPHELMWYGQVLFPPSLSLFFLFLFHFF